MYKVEEFFVQSSDIPEMGGDILNYGHRMEEILVHTSEEKLGLISTI